MKRNFVFLVIMLLGVCAFGQVPADYTYIGPAQNGFDLYRCDWAAEPFKNILAKDIKIDGVIVSTTIIPYGKEIYENVPIQEAENLPPGYYINAGMFPGGWYLAHCYQPLKENYPYKWIWIKENKVIACNPENVEKIVVSVTIVPVEE